VFLCDDGSVVCRTCETTPAVSEIAILLEAMLPASTRAPGGLRFTIARALLDVDVPPFDSLDDLSETLRRYERGPRDVVVRRVMERLASRRTLVPYAMADRRRHPRTTELRRALREADARLYLQKVATEAVAMTVASRPQRPRGMNTGIACVASGLLLIVAGEYVDGRHERAGAPAAAAPLPRPTSPELVRDTSLAEPDREPAALDRETRTVHPEPATPTSDPRASSSEPKQLSGQPAPLKQGSRTPDRAVRTPNADRRAPRTPKRASELARTRALRGNPRKASASRGVLEKFRLNWLRNVLTSL
jgi:hypothetical protein